MRKLTTILLSTIFISSALNAQKNVRTFIFGHSLINHEMQVNETPSQETSVPHWFHFLAEEAGHDYAVGGQYGFLPQHANVPPIAQWGFDYVPGAWDSDMEPFSEADFTNILITPGNFIQWQGPSVNYYGDDISPLDATNTVFNWCAEQEDNLKFFVYENWPDMAPYLANDFPPTAIEWQAYNEYLVGDFHDWFIEYHDSLILSHPNSCVRMIPVGPIISKLLLQAPYNEIPITELYEDDAPHGRPTTYFLAALATYMAMYEEKAPSTYEVDEIIHSVVRDNYQDIVDFIWAELNAFNDESSNNRVFCSQPTVNNIEREFERDLRIQPNPAKEYLYVTGDLIGIDILNLYNLQGQIVKSYENKADSNARINLNDLPKGVYMLTGKSNDNTIIIRQKIIKE